MKKTETLLTQFWVIIFITSEFNSYEKNRNFIDSILGNNLHNNSTYFLWRKQKLCWFSFG